MAYQQDFLDEEEQQKQSGPSQQTISAPSSSLQTNAQSTDTSKPRGSGFTNLSQYVDANKEQSSDMANKVTSGLRDETSGIQSGLDSLRSEGESKAKENTITDSGLVSVLQNTPEKVAAEEWKNAYSRQAGGYKGPSDITALTPYQDLSSRSTKLDQDVKSLDNPYSIGQTLRETYKSPERTYTKGENTLDSFLTTSGAGSQALGNFKNDYSNANVSGKFADTSSQVNDLLSAARNTSNQTQDATRTAYTNSLAARQASLDAAKKLASDEYSNAQLQAQRLRENLSGGQSDTLRSINYSQPTYEYLKSQNFDFNSLVNDPLSQSLGDVASQSEIDGYLALLGLTPGAQSQYDFSKTGRTAPSVTFNQANIDRGMELYDAERFKPVVEPTPIQVLRQQLNQKLPPPIDPNQWQTGAARIPTMDNQYSEFKDLDPKVLIESAKNADKNFAKRDKTKIPIAGFGQSIIPTVR